MAYKGAVNGRSVRAHLIVFGLAIVIPVIVFAGLLFGELQTIERQRTETLAHAVAQNVANDLDREVAGYTAILRALATSRSLKPSASPCFSARDVASARWMAV